MVTKDSGAWQIYRQTFDVWRSNWKSLLKFTFSWLFIPVFLEILLIHWFIILMNREVMESGYGLEPVNSPDTELLYYLVALWGLVSLVILFGPIVQGKLTRFVYCKLHNNNSSPNHQLPETQPWWTYPAVVLIYILIMALLGLILVTIGMYGSNTILPYERIVKTDVTWPYEIMVWAIGAICLIAYVYTNNRLTFLVQSLAIDGAGIRDAFRNTWKITHGKIFKISGYWGSLNAILSIITYSAAGLSYFYLFAPSIYSSLTIAVSTLLLSSFLLTILIVFLDTFRLTYASVLYFAFREKTNG